MAAPPAAAQAQMAAALNDHDRLKRSTEIPLFFGQKSRDSISARLLIDRINTAAQIANWDDARKLRELYMILRGNGLLWWKSLLDAGIDRDNWEAVKNAFLQSYEPKYTAKTTCSNLHELVQRQGEGAHDYYLRIIDTYERMCECRPDAVNDYEGVPPNGIAAADARTCKMQGIRDAERFFKHQLFLAGLKDDLRTRVMESHKATLYESMTFAMELEVIHAKNQGRTQVAAIGARGRPDDEDARDEDARPEDEEDDAEVAEALAAINAIRFRNGKPPLRTWNGRRTGNGTDNKKSVVCRFCRKTGHFQRDCFARKKVNGAMVDAKGKPYAQKTVAAAAVAANVSAVSEQESSASKVSAVETVVRSVNALNW
jgi:hypothetical protein